ncbi:MAG: DMT family transporter [Gammaproteobacteria bacterium]|jgi:drug/metabolite transporter (DMT)-like permease|nr:DMT family transporter [Gammaproteobacteria bacterium]
MKPTLPPLLAFTALLVLGSIWGSTILLSKHVVSTGHSALGLTFWQMTIGALVLSVVGWIRKSPLPMHPKDLRFYTIVALIGTLIPNSFSYSVAAHLPAGLMAITLATVPMFSLFIALVWHSEKPQPGRILGICLGAMAMLILLGPEASLPNASMAVWVLIALIAPFCYGFEGNYIARSMPAKMDAFSALRGSCIIGTLIGAPVVLATDNWVNLNTHWTSVEWGILLNSLLHIVTYGAYIWLVGRTGAVFASQVAYIVTLSGVFLGMIILNESHHTLVWLALALMMAGLALVQPKKAQATANQQ